MLVYLFDMILTRNCKNHARLNLFSHLLLEMLLLLAEFLLTYRSLHPAP
jgi:hypothetical protein